MDGTHITVIHLQVNINQCGTKRVEWHKTAWHVAALTSDFNIYWVGGMGAHLMQPCSTMLINPIWLSLQGNSIWLMLGSECVMHYLSHTKRSNTTLQNRAVQLWGMFMLLIIKRCWYMHRPSNAKELYNLWHASAQNIVEWIFGILKHCFWILTIPPESSMAIQACIPPALCTIHTFIWIHNPDKIHDFEIHDEHIDIEPYVWWTSTRTSGVTRDNMRNCQKRYYCTVNVGELSVGITNAWL